MQVDDGAPSGYIRGDAGIPLQRRAKSDDSYDLNPVSPITVGAIGKTGQRVFFMQAAQGYRLVSLRMEKEQVSALARGIEALLEELEQREIRATSTDEEPSADDLALQEPLEPVFSVGQMGLG